MNCGVPMPNITEPLRLGREARRQALGGGGDESGFIIIWALLTIFIVAGVIFNAMERVKSLDSLASFNFAAHGQAEEVAQAGLVDALAWYRRQASQPVTVFEPKGLPPVLRSYSEQPPEGYMPDAIVNTTMARPDPKLRLVSAVPGSIVLTPEIEWELTTTSYYTVEDIESE